ncbi:hypothetical protein [uncultured Nocardioides sp.]|uniref:hypothetical protein n=1 Tax=uncultured Nocardioides sp. TaxID=198441 RepID=UPI0026362006|nr:hypothetical protein [uncultured Nocardioides sp.]
MRPSRTVLSTTALAVAVTVLAGCGGGDDEPGSGAPGDEVSVGETLDPTADSTPLPDDVAASTTELRSAVRTFSDALLTGDGELAYAFYTAECQTKVPQGTYLLIVKRAGAVYGEPLPFATYEATVSEEETDAGPQEVAAVDYTFRGAKGLVQDDEEWTNTDEGWRLSDC